MEPERRVRFQQELSRPERHGRSTAAENFHLMISIWPFFEPGSANYDYMDKKGWFVDKFKYAKPPYHTERDGGV